MHMRQRPCGSCWRKQGMRLCRLKPGADVYVINTCTVTNIADRKSRQMLHRAQKDESGCGCRGDRLLRGDSRTDAAKKDPAIDIVLGNNRKGELLTVLGEYEEHRREKEYKEAFTDKIDINHTKEYENLQIRPLGSTYTGGYQGTGWLQSVLHILYYSVCPWTGAKPDNGRCAE